MILEIDRSIGSHWHQVTWIISSTLKKNKSYSYLKTNCILYYTVCVCTCEGWTESMPASFYKTTPLSSAKLPVWIKLILPLVSLNLENIMQSYGTLIFVTVSMNSILK